VRVSECEASLSKRYAGAYSNESELKRSTPRPREERAEQKHGLRCSLIIISSQKHAPWVARVCLFASRRRHRCQQLRLDEIEQSRGSQGTRPG
jgi:hypothetical protein